MTNRIDFTLSSITTAERPDPRFETVFAEEVRSRFLFYIENQINISISAHIRKRRGSETSHGLSMSIGYRLQ